MNEFSTMLLKLSLTMRNAFCCFVFTLVGYRTWYKYYEKIQKTNKKKLS